MLYDKYIKAEFFLDMPHESPVWSSILKVMAALREGYYLRIGDDSSLFWYSLWSDHSPLCDQVFAIDIHDINLQIKDLYVNNQWQWSPLYSCS